jgi:anaerobic selenocysteine-containing dehydrogenase
MTARPSKPSSSTTPTPAQSRPTRTPCAADSLRPDLFTVVHELFFTDTTDYADYILPATTFLEHTDIQGAYGHYFVQLSQQAIEPPGEARSNVWLFSQLAQRMGFPEPCFRDTARRHHPSGPRPPSGKVEFYSEALAAVNMDPLPNFTPPTESRWGVDAARYPLELLARKADNYMNSTFANLPGHRKMESRTNQRLEIHPEDAQARGIAEGEAVQVFNDRGSLRLIAHVNGSVPAGVVAAQLDWAKLSSDNNNVNSLTSERLTDLGAGATFYSTLVQVTKE